MKKILIGISFMATLVFGFVATSAHAQTAATSDATSSSSSTASSTPVSPCDVGQQLANLKAAKVAAAQGDIETEISLKKTILKNVLLCASQEAQDLKVTVNSVQTNDSDIAAVRAATLQRLDDISSYYDTRIKDTDTLTTLRGVQDLSKTVLNERSNTYAPFTRSTLNFVVWTGNQKIFKAAAARFNQVTQTMNALKLVDNGDLQAIYNDATQNFDAAKTENNQARTLVLTMSPAEDSSPVIQDSLDKLSAAYNDFIQLSDKIGKALPQ